ncbi:hypothetical protein C8J27_101746 [Rhodobacter aestuarii]|uniref:Uncharacterized protein n=1 Tax=Rhodobacter aestuarii TaxID=453582 RepID=A0A1N7P6V7_9RHOB|nr:hypothetical protein [Rhodobacter aestuarii]PTV97629.1 hypothetical protein C8J27_101746 [Rhodobacter aestuarii]SIT06324.1 hypothetical protein SAMN05421580_109106 [Rhodobacter aestuarii]
MVWLHITPHPAQNGSALGPWLGRVIARLRAPFSTSAPPAGRTHAERAAYNRGFSEGFSAGFTRVAPLSRLPMPSAPANIAELSSEHSPEAAPTAEFSATSSTTQLASASSVRAAPKFHAVDADEISLVLLLSRRAGSELPCIEWISEHGLPFRRIAALQPTSPIWSAPHGALLLVDLDTLGGVAVMAESLMRLREGRPDISIVLLSEEVAGHDFGLERLALADITLRLPCAFASFEFALAEAPINNAIWQERMAEASMASGN